MKKLISNVIGFVILLVLTISFLAPNVLVAKIRAVGGGTVPNSPFGYPVGLARCQITEPITTATIFMTYPFPDEHEASIGEQIRMAAGQTVEPTSLPSKEFKLEWSVVMDKADQRNRYDVLTAAQGYTAFLSSDASGNDGVTKINNAPVSLSGSRTEKIKNDPIIYTLTVKKDGVEVADCSVTVKHNVSWIEVTAPPATAKPTGNSLFPYKVKDILGTDYVTRPFPLATEYSLPFKKFIGRYYDGSGSAFRYFDWGSLGYWPGFRGPQEMKESSTYLIMPMSASLVGYKKSTFISRLQSEQLLYFRGNTWRGTYYDSLIPWDTILQLDPAKSGMYLAYDEPCRLTVNGIDVDDRGYVYFTSASCRGTINIAVDNGSGIRPAAQIMGQEEVQFATQSPYTKTKIIGLAANIESTSPTVFKSGSSYYLIQSSNSSPIINVTDPYNPTLHRINSGYLSGVQAGNVIANKVLVSGVGEVGDIQLYDSADFINGLAPKKTFTAPVGGYRSLTADKATGRFFAIGYSSHPNPKSNIPRYELPKATLSVFAPGVGGGADSYTETKLELSATSMGGVGGNWSVAKYIFLVTQLQYHNGYLLARSEDKGDIKMWRLNNNVLTELDTKGFIKKYYGEGWLDPADGSREGSNMTDVSIHTLGGKDYLFVNTQKYGDVYELESVVNQVSYTTAVTSSMCFDRMLANGSRGDDVKRLQQSLTSDGFSPGTADGIYGPLTESAVRTYQTKNNLPPSGKIDSFRTVLAKSINFIKRAVAGKSISSFGKLMQAAVAGALAENVPPRLTDLNNTTINVKVGESVSFNWNATDADKDDLLWGVNWGDEFGATANAYCSENPPTGTSKNWNYKASHSWGSPGVYTVTVFISDCRDNTGTVRGSFNVNVGGASGGTGGNTGGTGGNNGGNENPATKICWYI